MRFRYVISAAILLGAALARRRSAAARPQMGLPAPAGSRPSPEPRACDIAVADTPEPEARPVPVEAARNEPEEAAPDVVVEGHGRFALAGEAFAPGHAIVGGFSFSHRLADPASADAIQLIIESSENVPGGGLVVLREAGFAPDTEGFTLMLASSAAGRFAATGRYELVGQNLGARLDRVPSIGGIAR